ncbi:MAG TPA: hypothetical protein VFO91_02210, partial [Anaerolineales bacterium]|nr:hypothetical protein [Anaerolineales bacterium]
VSRHARLWRQLKDLYADIGDIFPYKIRRVVYVFKTITPIETITRTWLRKHDFEFDNLMVEMGSEEVADPSAHVHNRFYASRMLPIKYFIEDDLIKAEKLAYICDVIFLIDQPYNQKENLVGNIIRVKDWGEIIQYMREFS